ncbi:hypothetical protein F2Q69_00055747 [Brassica cretica]|uniref:Uncharacterized protein n=1 Tax=Brassica cretica TaxID=69181 RepID=A0A8S9MV73_BRACR|nr:hypothetical protein F2Q69_00055747 [Brassica cretica]
MSNLPQLLQFRERYGPFNWSPRLGTDTHPNRPWASSSMAIGLRTSQAQSLPRARARSLRIDRARTQLGRYVATEHAHGSDRACTRQRPSSSQARSLRSDRARAKLGRYISTEHVHGLVVT